MCVIKKTAAGLRQMPDAVDLCKDFDVTVMAVASEMVKGSCDHETATLRLAERAQNSTTPSPSPVGQKKGFQNKKSPVHRGFFYKYCLMINPYNMLFWLH